MKTLNKDLEIIKLNKTEVLVISRIKPPMFFIGNKKFTEYDIRNLQLEISMDNISHTIANELKVQDEDGLILNFREDGVLANSPKGYQILSRMVLDMFKTNRK